MKITSSWIIVFGFFSRMLVAIWNGFYGSAIGADADAIGFHEAARFVALSGTYQSFNIGTAPYINTLAILYRIVGGHIFIGSVASCLFWMASAYVLRQSFLLMQMRIEAIKKAMFIYAFIPSALLFTAVTLREVYQLFFVNLAVFSLCKVHLQKRHGYMLLFLVALIGAGVLHGALMAFAIMAFIAAALFMYFPSIRRLSVVGLGIFVGASLIITVLALRSFELINYDLSVGINQAISSYQEGGLGVSARAMYKNESDNAGLIFYLVSMPVGFFQYLFEPMPWRSISVIDIPVVAENILRAFLIYKACRHVGDLGFRKKPFFFLLFFLYILLELIWSLGTINWGTAIRHHVPATGLLLLIAYFKAGQYVKLPITYTRKYRAYWR